MIALTSPVRTAFHGIPAGVKLALLAAATFALFLVEDPWILGGCAAGVAGLYLSGGARFAGAALEALTPLWPFFAVLTVWHVATDDVVRGVAIMLRMAAAFGLANLVTMTTRLDDMVSVASWLMRPLRLVGLKPSHFALAVAMVVRFTPVLIEKGAVLSQSWRSRSPRGPGWRVALPMMLAAIDDAEHVAEALRARGGLDPAPGAPTTEKEEP